MDCGYVIAWGLVAALLASVVFLATRCLPVACAVAGLIWLPALAIAWLGADDEDEGGGLE
jgi:hypothetical protein